MDDYIYIIRNYVDGDITLEPHRSKDTAEAVVESLYAEALAEVEGVDKEVHNKYDDSYHIVTADREFFCMIEEHVLN